MESWKEENNGKELAIFLFPLPEFQQSALAFFIGNFIAGFEYASSIKTPGCIS